MDKIDWFEYANKAIYSIKLNHIDTRDRSKELVGIGDLHRGASNCDIKQFDEAIDYCKDSGAWILLMGDLGESATRKSVGAGIYEQKLTPQEQLDDIVERLYPVRNQIIGAHLGNHEYRLWKEVGMNFTKIMCDQLKIPYLGYSVNHVIKVGSERYIVFSTHGCSKAAMRHTKLKAVMDIARWNTADLYMYAHLHSLDYNYDIYQEYNSRNKVMDSHKRHYVITGAFLSYADSYAEMKLYQPEQNGFAKIKLFGDEHKIEVTF